MRKRAMRTLVISVCALALLTGVAYSQEPDKAAAERLEQKNQKELDSAYKAASSIKRAPAAPVDPWGGVRPTNNSNTTTK
jgi:hypothetical protein